MKSRIVIRYPDNDGELHIEVESIPKSASLVNHIYTFTRCVKEDVSPRKALKEVALDIIQRMSDK